MLDVGHRLLDRRGVALADVVGVLEVGHLPLQFGKGSRGPQCICAAARSPGLRDERVQVGASGFGHALAVGAARTEAQHQCRDDDDAAAFYGLTACSSCWIA